MALSSITTLPRALPSHSTSSQQVGLTGFGAPRRIHAHEGQSIDTHTHTLPCGNLSSGGGVLDDGADGDEGRRCENDNGAKEGNNNGRA